MFVTLLGPTASGKTRLAAYLAWRMNGVVISADSRQIYKGMDIGTGKDLNDYVVHGKKIKVYLIDLVEPGYEYNVFEYQQDFLKVYRELERKNIPVVFCGGSGMYIEAILKAYPLIKVPPNPELRARMDKMSDEELVEWLASYRKLHNKTDTEDRERLYRAIEIEEYYQTHGNEFHFPRISGPVFGLKIPREILVERIRQRLEKRFEEGMIEEAKRLVSEGLSLDKMKYYGLEYRYLAMYLGGEISFEEMKEKLWIAIRQFAKRQMTWFRRMERQGIRIKWLDGLKPVEENAGDILKSIHFSES